MFVQNPNGVLASDTRVSFTCQVTVPEVYWIVNGVRLDNATTNSDVQIITSVNHQNSTVSILSTLAKSDGNNTNVTCVAVGINSNGIDQYTSCIVVAGEF